MTMREAWPLLDRKEERLSEGIGPTFVPGDPIMYLIRFKCKANVLTVSAVFVAE